MALHVAPLTGLTVALASSKSALFCFTRKCSEWIRCGWLKDEHALGAVVLEALRHGIAPGPGNPAMQEQRPAPVPLAEPTARQLAHLPKLGEDPDLLVGSIAAS